VERMGFPTNFTTAELERLRELVLAARERRSEPEIDNLATKLVSYCSMVRQVRPVAMPARAG